MPGNKKCEPGCTCAKHTDGWKERLRVKGKQQFIEEGGQEVRAERARAMWAARSPEERQAITSKAIAAARASSKIYNAETVAKRSESLRKTWEGKSLEERRRHLAPALKARGNHFTDLEVEVAAWLTRLEISFVYQHQIGPYLADFYLPDFNVVLEVDGDYWHRNKAKDDARDSYIVGQGYRLFRLQESLVKEDALKAIVNVLLYGNARKK